KREEGIVTGQMLKSRGPQPGLEFLQPLAVFRADQERRLLKAKRLKVVEAGIMNYPNPQARVAALIEDLDEVSHYPGWSMYYDEVIIGWAREGDAAVEPLLRCIEQDERRLTRDVYVGQNDFWFTRDRVPQFVEVAAMHPLFAIMQTE